MILYQEHWKRVNKVESWIMIVVVASFHVLAFPTCRPQNILRTIFLGTRLQRDPSSKCMSHIRTLLKSFSIPQLLCSLLSQLPCSYILPCTLLSTAAGRGLALQCSSIKINNLLCGGYPCCKRSAVAARCADSCVTDKLEHWSANPQLLTWINIETRGLFIQ